MLPLRFLDEADAELEWASGRAELEHRGRGRRLLLDAREVAAWAHDFPHSGTLIEDVDAEIELRGFLLAKFKYTMVMAVLEEEIVVVAFAHQSREPGYWKDRIAKIDD